MLGQLLVTSGSSEGHCGHGGCVFWVTPFLEAF